MSVSDRLCCWLYLTISASIPPSVLQFASKVPTHSGRQGFTSIKDLIILGTDRNLDHPSQGFPRGSEDHQMGQILLLTFALVSSHLHTRELPVFCTTLN